MLRWRAYGLGWERARTRGATTVTPITVSCGDQEWGEWVSVEGWQKLQGSYRRHSRRRDCSGGGQGGQGGRGEAQGPGEEVGTALAKARCRSESDDVATRKNSAKQERLRRQRS